MSKKYIYFLVYAQNIPEKIHTEVENSDCLLRGGLKEKKTFQCPFGPF